MPPEDAAGEAPTRMTGRLPEEISFVFWAEQARIVRRNWRTLVLSIVVGFSAGLIAWAIRPALYAARTTIEVQAATDNTFIPSAGKFGTALDSELVDLQTQIRVLQSTAVSDRARLRLAARKFDQAAVDRAFKSLNVQAAGPTRIILVDSQSTEPVVAAETVNAVAEEFINRHNEARQQALARTAEHLHSAIEEMRAKLELADQTVQNYARESGIVLTGDRESLFAEKLRHVQEALTRVEAERIANQARQAASSRASDENLPAILNEPDLKAVQSKLADLERQKAELRVTYTADAPKVQRLSAQIASLQADWAAQIQTARARVRNELEESQYREVQLQNTYQAQKQLLAEEQQKRVHYDLLKGEADSTRALYDSMLTQAKQAGVSSAMRGGNVRVLDAAQPAKRATEPRLASGVLLGSMAGVLFGFAIANGRDQSRAAIQEPREAVAASGAPELGIVRLSGAGSALEAAWRSVVAGLMLPRSQGMPAAWAICGPNTGTGATTTVVQLGRALARTGKRVLLIDADFNHPELTVRVHMDAVAGCRDLLASTRPLDVLAIAPTVLNTPTPGLFVMPSGTAHPNASDLLYGERFPEIIAYARKNFDTVLIDTPPLLEISDTRVIGRLTDGVILAVRMGKTTQQAVREAARRLAEDGTRMTGTVLIDHNAGARTYTERRSIAAQHRSTPLAKRASA